MISCTEFIPAYSQVFKYLHEKEGYAGVVKFWEHISDEYVEPRLGQLIKEKGIAGCYEYWSKSLNEENADFYMTLDEEKGEFEIVMNKCPSKGMLLKLDPSNVYTDYCDHCDLLYRRVVEKYGLSYYFEPDKDNMACCRLKVTIKTGKAHE